jgi:hypothetical protein
MAAAMATSCVVAGPGGAVAADLLRRRIAEQADRCAMRVFVAPPFQVARMLPSRERASWRPPARLGSEGFAIRRIGRSTVVTARGTRGLVQGAGWVQRHMTVADGVARVSTPARVDEAPALPVRMTQIGYRPKNNSYDAWTLPMFKRRLEDFALWGASGVQLIAPVSDDAPTSPLFPAPPPKMLPAIALAAHRLGLDVALYYPLLGDYEKPGAVAAEVRAFAATLAMLPQIEALYVPGGDPGHTMPDRLFPLVSRLAAIARHRNPRTGVWLSTQGFDSDGLDAFYRQLDQQPRWLTGIFMGPQTRESVERHRARVPARYPLILYPDVAHTMHAQFPVPEWWPEFALTEGREPINPRPLAYTKIFRRFAPLSRGFVTYSEGVNSDFNELLWLRMGWDPTVDPRTVATDYARAFIGDPRAADAIFALEQNWIGDPATNRRIDATLALVDGLRPAAHADWRIYTLRYRAIYDEIVRRRAISARTRRAAVYVAPNIPAVRAALDTPDDPSVANLRARLFATADRLWRAARLQLSVPRYGASSVERGANLDRVDVDLTGRIWLERALARGFPLPDRSRRAEGALYDDLGRPDAELHLVRGKSFDADPQLLETAIDGVADRTAEDGWNPAELDYAETLYDEPLRLHYDGLDPKRRYHLIATYAGEDYALPMRLVADGRWEVHPPLARTTNPMTVDYPIPTAATADGKLDLAWTRPPGMGGSGRGHQVAETWLIPEYSGANK